MRIVRWCHGGGGLVEEERTSLGQQSQRSLPYRMQQMHTELMCTIHYRLRSTLGLESNVTEQWCGVDGMEKRPVVRKICGRAPRFLTGAVAANASRNGGHAHSQAAQINAAAHTIRHHAYHRRAQVHRGSITTICSAGLINPERLTLKSSNRISHRALPNIAANACKLRHRRRELA